MRKQVFCIRCGTKLHPTDWEILKYNNQLPICDECDLKYTNKDMKAEGTIKINSRSNK